MTWWREHLQEAEWQTIMAEPAPLVGLAIGGSDKALALVAALKDGRVFGTYVSDFVVSTDGAVEMHLERVDDLNVVVRYAGPGLELRSMQVFYPDPDCEEEFTAVTSDFIANGGNLPYLVGVKIALAALPVSPAHVGDPQ